MVIVFSSCRPKRVANYKHCNQVNTERMSCFYLPLGQDGAMFHSRKVFCYPGQHIFKKISVKLIGSFVLSAYLIHKIIYVMPYEIQAEK